MNKSKPNNTKGKKGAAARAKGTNVPQVASPTPQGPANRPTTNVPAVGSTISFGQPLAEPSGLPIAKPLASYKGAQGGPQSVPWSYSPLDPRQRYGTDFDRRTMMNRARELERNNPIAAGLLLKQVQNVVGDGLKLDVTTADPEWNKQAQALMENWSAYADISGLSWLEWQQKAYKCSRRDCDVAIVLLDNGQIQTVLGDQIGSPVKFQGDPNWIDGVHYNINGTPDAYAFTTINTSNRQDYTPVDAVDVILFANRGDGIRGISQFAPTFNLFDQLDSYIEALVVNMRISACYALTIEKEGATDTIQGLQNAANAQAAINQATLAQTGTNVTSTTTVIAPPTSQMKLAPGMINYVEKGDTITQLKPEQPTSSFPDSLRMLLKIIGAPHGMPLELVLGDFKDVSGPTARVALQIAFTQSKIERKKFTDTVLSRIYRWRISKFIKAGALPYRPDAFNHRWVGTPFPVLDSLREYEAAKLAIDSGFETQTSVLQQYGHDFTSWLSERADELNQQREKNIPLLHSAQTQPFVNIRINDQNNDPSINGGLTPPSKKDGADSNQNIDDEVSNDEESE